MGQRKTKLRKLKQKKERAKKRVLIRRSAIREEARLKKEIERIKWENREKIKPFRKDNS